MERSCVGGSSEWARGKGSSPRGWRVTGTGSPGKRPRHQACLCSRRALCRRTVPPAPCLLLRGERGAAGAQDPDALCTVGKDRLPQIPQLTVTRRTAWWSPAGLGAAGGFVLGHSRTGGAGDAGRRAVLPVFCLRHARAAQDGCRRLSASRPALPAKGQGVPKPGPAPGCRPVPLLGAAPQRVHELAGQKGSPRPATAHGARNTRDELGALAS